MIGPVTPLRVHSGGSSERHINRSPRATQRQRLRYNRCAGGQTSKAAPRGYILVLTATATNVEGLGYTVWSQGTYRPALLKSLRVSGSWFQCAY